MAHRDSDARVKLRRQKVHRYRSLGYGADEIWNALKAEFPSLTLMTVYNDIKFLKEHSKEYIALEYIPNFGDEFAQAMEIINFAIGEAASLYWGGTEEKHDIILPDGRKMTKLIRKSKDARLLQLLSNLAKMKIDTGDSAPVVSNVTRMTEELKRLRADHGNEKREEARVSSKK